MARKRRHKTTSKYTPAVIFAVLIFGVIASLFGHNDKTSEPAPAGSPNAELASTAPAAEQLANPPRSAKTESRVEVTSLPVPPPQAQVETKPKLTLPTRYVIGRKVALRGGPGKSSGILDRYDSGREVAVIDTRGGWSHVRDGLTQREGWISTSLLADLQPLPPQTQKKQKADPEKKEKAPPAPPMTSESVVIQRLIAESIALYPGTCACPYNTDRRGRACGRRSAYSKGGGYAPLCYPQYVSAGKIANFRTQAKR